MGIEVPQAETATRRLLYAVGDIHGRADLLADLMEKIRRDVEESAPAQRPILIFVGDYIDRGPSSREVVDIILALQDEGAFSVGALRGNHDQFLLDFLQDGRSGPMWLAFGGAATLAAYGVKPPRVRTDNDAWAETAAELALNMPPEHRGFFESTAPMAVFENFVLVHAGIRPNIPLEDQAPEDLLGIRNTFLLDDDPSPGRIVVFGHTPQNEPLLTRSKIGIDTGAYATGVLTALRLFEGRPTFIQTHGPGQR
jgi:serine/threonine protein phosphatase 1